MVSNNEKSRATGRITLADVARLAGVSPITVSRVLRGSSTVDASLAQRVRIATSRLGYVPDPAARALASSRSSHVAVLIPMLSNALFVDLLEAILSTLRPAGFQTLIGITHYSLDEEEQLLREQLLHRPAGMLITGLEHNRATQSLIDSSGVPCVHLMELSKSPDVYSVGFSQEAAGAALTRHLIERGRRRIVFAAAQLDPRALQRRDGWMHALREAGLFNPQLERLTAEPSSIVLGARMFETIVGSDKKFDVDAIFFCNDDLAQGALLAAQRLGIVVPRDIAIAGFNDLMGSDQMLPSLTTVRTPRVEIGSGAAQMLLDLMSGQQVKHQCIDLGYELVVRGST
jgi:LacI family gluconate utilization system Gnt-I transcriptional repressor